MEFFKKETRIDFMGIRRYTGFVILLLWILAIGGLITKGLNFGLDFTGGTQIEAKFMTATSSSEVREELEHQGFQGARVQQQGSVDNLLIRIGSRSFGDKCEQKTQNECSSLEKEIGSKVLSILKAKHPGVEIRRTEFVGSEVGAQLVEQGGIAVLVSILATMIYIAMRFEYRLAVSTAVGLVHDAVLILGVFALFGFEFDLATMASVLAVLGYSLNDTIVVFDRIRENFRKVRKGTPIEIVNLSINQTLSRTLMTSFMTLLVVLALLFFGGESLFGFSMAFFIGILIGTFSSIYVSGALALWMELSRADLLPKPKVEFEGP